MASKKLMDIGNSKAVYLPKKALKEMGVENEVDVFYDSLTQEIVIRNVKTASSQDNRLKRLVKDAVIEALSDKDK
ncbi:hypothetical protein BEH_07585 [Priestia filamentosa]|uniref:SpoVT-AbrB domain-containing protein n=1 Tax=Priestia filamentosa TaxID=1402861 RepID=A0A0H4KGN6_9BACI|nr:hypothetical protein [Priestia filamentosa]AKO91971.1 hypothetical protein BEH_07585 [Priestia filamentosa]